MLKLSIETEMDDVFNQLRENQLYIKNVSKKVLSALSSRGRTKVRQAYNSSGLHKKSGELYKYIYKISKNNNYAIIGMGQPYKAQTLVYGLKILPKNGKYLTFKIGNDWKKVTSVQNKPHDIFFGPLDKFTNSQEFTDLFIGVVMKGLKK